MTFPGVVLVAVSGEEGEGQPEEKVLQARDQEVSFEALSMRPTAVSLIGLLCWVGSGADCRQVRCVATGLWGKLTPSRIDGYPNLEKLCTTGGGGRGLSCVVALPIVLLDTVGTL